jgi:hypothetical protein
LNNGGGFDSPKTIYSQSLPAGSSPGYEYTTPLYLVLGDFDADGHADLVVRTTESDPNNAAAALVTLTALYGSGAGTFVRKTIAVSHTAVREIAAARLNADGTSDIVENGFSIAYPIRIFYGQIDRTFSAVNQAAANDRVNTPMLADFNGDKQGHHLCRPDGRRPGQYWDQRAVAHINRKLHATAIFCQ